MKKLILLSVISFFTIVALGQEDTTKRWDKGGIINLNFSQVQLSNWAAGGQNSFSGNGLISLYANYSEGNSAWDNTLDLGYGILKNEDENQRKSDDKIEFSSKYGYKASKRWFYTVLFSFKTQFAEGYNYPNDSVVISNFFAPAYFNFSVGMDYKPNKKFTCYLSPLSAKATFVNDQNLADAGAFGVDPAEYDATTGLKTKNGRNSLYEFGGLIKVVYKNEIMKNVNLQSKLELFSNYVDNPQNIDVNWENMINLKVNEYISANILLHLIYDDNIEIDTNDDGLTDGPQVQFKEVFGLGFSYKF